MAIANATAQWHDEAEIGTAHILYGILKIGDDVGTGALANLGVDLEALRSALKDGMQCGGGTRWGRLPLSPRAARAVEHALEEKRHAGFRYMGTEHLLLGLLHDPDCAASRAMSRVCPAVTVDRLTDESLRLLRDYPHAANSGSQTRQS